MTFTATSNHGASTSTALARLQKQIQTPFDPATSFPCMLHQCLTDIEALEERDPSMGKKLSQVIGWQRQGTVFRVHDRKKFEELIMPVWFCRLKYTSFVRQLTLYGFKKIQKDEEVGSGLQKGAVYHELFLQGQPELAKRIGKASKKQSSSSLPGLPPSPSASSLQDAQTMSAITSHKLMSRMSMGGGMNMNMDMNMNMNMIFHGQNPSFHGQNPPSPTTVYGYGSANAYGNGNGLVHMLAPARSMMTSNSHMQQHYNNQVAAAAMTPISSKIIRNDIIEERNPPQDEQQPLPELDVSDLMQPDLPKVDFSFLDMNESQFLPDASLPEILEPTPFPPVGNQQWSADPGPYFNPAVGYSS